jgi:hypothetical protein
LSRRERMAELVGNPGVVVNRVQLLIYVRTGGIGVRGADAGVEPGRRAEGVTEIILVGESWPRSERR